MASPDSATSTASGLRKLLLVPLVLVCLAWGAGLHAWWVSATRPPDRRVQFQWHEVVTEDGIGIAAIRPQVSVDGGPEDARWIILLRKDAEPRPSGAGVFRHGLLTFLLQAGGDTSIAAYDALAPGGYHAVAPRLMARGEIFDDAKSNVFVFTESDARQFRVDESQLDAMLQPIVDLRHAKGWMGGCTAFHKPDDEYGRVMMAAYRTLVMSNESIREMLAGPRREQDTAAERQP